MKNSLFYKISHKFHQLGFFIYSFKFYYQDNSKKQGKIKCFFKAIKHGSKIFNYKNGHYEYLEIPITTKCSLRCKHCSNLIPCYNKQKDYDTETLKESIQEFLKCINNIVFIRILGGEPFLSKNLYEIIEELIKSDKIQRIEIVTNGTIIPKEKKLLEILNNNKIIVSISKYPNVDYNKVVEILKDNNIKYKIDAMTFWMDYGKPEKRNKSEKELITQFSKCNNVCKSLVNGQIHLCPRSSHGTDLGIIKNNEDDYLNLLDDKLSLKEKEEKLNKVFSKKYITACDYCVFGTNESKKIPVAEQLKK